MCVAARSHETSLCIPFAFMFCKTVDVRLSVVAFCMLSRNGSVLLSGQIRYHCLVKNKFRGLILTQWLVPGCVVGRTGLSI